MNLRFLLQAISMGTQPLPLSHLPHLIKQDVIKWLTLAQLKSQSKQIIYRISQKSNALKFLQIPSI